MIEIRDASIQVVLLYLKGAEGVVRLIETNSAVNHQLVFPPFGKAAIVECRCEFRVELQSTIEIGHGSVPLALLHFREAAAVICFGEFWIEL